MFVRIHEPFILLRSAAFEDLIIVNLRRKSAFLPQFTSKFSLHHFQGKRQNMLGNCTLPTSLYIFHFVISSTYKLLLNQLFFVLLATKGVMITYVSKCKSIHFCGWFQH